MDDGREALSVNSIADGVYPLPGYARRSTPNGEVVGMERLIDSLSSIVTVHGTLYGWARAQPQPRALSGRAPVFIARLPDHPDTTVVVRHSWHGGLLKRVTRDRFRRPTRAPIELLRSFMLRECRIPTPEIVGFALYRAGPGLARVDVGTRYIPGSYDFAAVLGNRAPGIVRDEAFAAIEVLLHQLASNGFTHPDLNVKNILLHRNQSGIEASVLDVDVMEWDRHMPAVSVMQLNVARLVRSLIKARRQFGIVFTDSERDAFRQRMTATTSRDVRMGHQDGRVTPGSAR